MDVLTIVFGVLLMLCSVALIVIIMFQEQKGRGLSGAIGGDSANMAGGRVRGNDVRMAKLTKVLGIVFFVLVILEGIFSLLK